MATSHRWWPLYLNVKHGVVDNQMFKTKTKTFIFVLEAPRDQDPGLEDYITALISLFLLHFFVDGRVVRYIL